MLVTVAVARGCDPLDLVDAPLWRVLWTFHHLEELEERRALARRLERVDAGFMAARAFNAPATLADELQHVHDAIEAYERGPEDVAEEFAALRARGEALAARIAAGRVLSPEALLPS